jgi:hypothetical protein
MAAGRKRARTREPPRLVNERESCMIPSRRFPVALCLAVVLLGIGGCGNSPESVARTYAECMARGDLDGVRAVSAGDQGRKSSSPMGAAGVALVADGVRKMGGVRAVEILEATVEGDTATVKVRMVPNDPDHPMAARMLKGSKSLALERIDGRWKVVDED